MKKSLLAVAVLGLMLASCNKKHDCTCTSEVTVVEDGVTATTKDDDTIVYHDQKDDCSSKNTTYEETDEKDSYTYKTTCVED